MYMYDCDLLVFPLLGNMFIICMNEGKFTMLIIVKTADWNPFIFAKTIIKKKKKCFNYF